MESFAPNDAASYKVLARSWAASVTIVTCRRPGPAFTLERPELDGFTATAFLTISIDPPIILVSVANGSGAFDLLTDVTAFAVNLLAADQAPVAQEFARTQSERGHVFERFAWMPDMAGVPLIGGALGAFSATVRERIPMGDHLLVLGDVTQLHRSGRLDTLVYHNRGFGQVKPHGLSDTPAQ